MGTSLIAEVEAKYTAIYHYYLVYTKEERELILEYGEEGQTEGV